MKSQFLFERKEIKFVINENQYNHFIKLIKNYIIEDNYKKSTIYNIYFDTSNDQLIRKSIEKPIYKEKLRLRSYTIINEEANVFIELKKKYKETVYKRREKMSYCEAKKFLSNPIPYSQITKEIAYFLSYYKNLQPRMFLYYDRDSYVSKDDKDLRITFDQNIIYRNYDLKLENGIYGEKLLNDGTYIMEIKTNNALPLWLVKALSSEKIYKSSFSKYGKAYEAIRGGKKYGKLI